MTLLWRGRQQRWWCQASKKKEGTRRASKVLSVYVLLITCDAVACDVFVFSMQAVSELRLLVGEEHLQGLSAADCVAGLYYMTAFR